MNSKAQTHWIDSKGVRLHAVTLGNSQHTPLVLVHGYPDNLNVWNPIAHILAQTHYVIAYDVRGAGQSDRPKRTADYRLPLLAQDLRAVVDQLIPGRSFHLAGHDWGSLQSWESVTSGPLQPRILSYTTLSGPSLDHVGYWMRSHLISTSPEAIRKAVSQLFSSWYIMLFQLPLVAPSLWRLFGERAWPRYLKAGEGIQEPEDNPCIVEDGRYGVQLYRANFLPKMFKPEARPARCPVQLIIPTRDNFVGPQLFDDLHLWVDRLYRRELDAGHWVVLKQPARIAEWILDFVNSVDSGNDSPELAQARVTA